MNAHFTRKPTPKEVRLAADVSNKARELVREFQGEVGDMNEWPNTVNVHNTRTALLAYIAELEARR